MGAPLKDTLVSQLYVFGRSKARQPSLINHFRPSQDPSNSRRAPSGIAGGQGCPLWAYVPSIGSCYKG